MNTNPAHYPQSTEYAEAFAEWCGVGNGMPHDVAVKAQAASAGFVPAPMLTVDADTWIEFISNDLPDDLLAALDAHLMTVIGDDYQARPDYIFEADHWATRNYEDALHDAFNHGTGR